AHLRLAPLGDVFADGDDVRHLVALHLHRNLRDAIHTRLAEGRGLDRELLHLSRLEHALELAAQKLRGLPVKNLEDRSADRFFARHAVDARLALAVPRLDAIRAIDHVEADRKRIDDLLGEASLLVDLPRSRGNLRLETRGMFGIAQCWRE